MQYLIDGYNLLYAIGLLHERRRGRDALQTARARLLGLLHGALGDRSCEATVIFDSGPEAPHYPREQVFRGIHIRFSEHPNKADDVIAQLVRAASAPRNLTVVSDDHEVQRSAHRRHCPVVGCTDFMADLHRLRKPPPNPDPLHKPTQLSEGELADWLGEFGDLDESPEMQELCEPHDFLDFDPTEETD